MNTVETTSVSPHSSNAVLCAVFIDELPNTNEKVIDKYLRTISKEIAKEAKVLGIQKARQNANIKYGKFWRERLTMKKIYNTPNPFGKMSYW
jgi:hypothetical protein